MKLSKKNNYYQSIEDNITPDVICPVCKARLKINYWLGIGRPVKSQEVIGKTICPSCENRMEFTGNIEVTFDSNAKVIL